MSVDSLPPNGQGVKQTGAAKTARIPIKVQAAPLLPKPPWIRVRAPSSPRFFEIKRILQENQLHTCARKPRARHRDASAGHRDVHDHGRSLHGAARSATSARPAASTPTAASLAKRSPR
jgi:hypothetical protein